MFGFATIGVVRAVSAHSGIDRERYRAMRERYWKNRARRDALRAKLDEEARRLETALQVRGLKVDVLG